MAARPQSEVISFSVVSKNAEKSPIPETPRHSFSKPYKSSNYNNKKVTKDRILIPTNYAKKFQRKVGKLRLVFQAFFDGFEFKCRN
jgi:hypothetical protein